MSQIGSQKRLLTRFTNTLENIVEKLNEEKLTEISWDDLPSEEAMRDAISRLEEGITVLDCTTLKIEKQLSDYALVIDNLEKPAETELEQYDQYASRAEAAMGKAFDLSILLQAQIRVAKAIKKTSLPISEQVNHPRVTQPRTKQLELPPLPIPTFSGDLWEWDNFWELYNNNIHSQDLPEMVKYNYLLNALRGPAKESVKKFQLTKGNYDKTIQFLLNKYNNRDLLVNKLVERLDKCALRGRAVKDQRSLLEEIQAIVAQLVEKGENVDSSWLIKKVLSKFPSEVKRKVIARKQGNLDAQFQMQDLIRYLEDYLSTEELCNLYVGEKPTDQQSSRYASTSKNSVTSRKRTVSASCMYCKGEHPAFACTVFPTPQARSRYLRENQLCFLCASSAHKTLQCTRRPCFFCKAAHHSSCCFNRQKREAEPIKKPDTSSATKKPSEKGKKLNKVAASVNSNQVSNVTDQETSSANIDGHDTVLQLQAMTQVQQTNRSALPTGEITVLDPTTKGLRKVDVLFDSGAEVSFINASLANELCLPVIREESIRIHTFGSKDVQQATCKLVKLDVWDAEGNVHTFYLRTHNVLTQVFPTPRIPDADRQEILDRKLSVQHLDTDKVIINPLILLGCDQMWSLFRMDLTPISLSSGLVLIPTKLGYVVSGQSKTVPQEKTNEILQVSSYNEDLERWSNYWSMEVQMNTIQYGDPQVSEIEQEKWDSYWAMDAAGTEQFMGPLMESREALDKKVWEQFNKTIEKRQDGYYVRLPWKEQYPYLPDNYAIAYKRLINVWASLRKDEALLEQYNNVFQEQLQKNIVEVVDDNCTETGNQVHYIPHQPVLTPQKTTTKLRIVFDASAHYKGSPSLNDALHRGPVILPALYGLLLRFQIGTIALISDVEKAFLQIRLHEADRDATRCLWLRDHRKPPEKNNILTLRFTRVTFGIKSSPFLLAGTTMYHLDTYCENPLAQEIKNNIYVDNLILTSDSCQESIQIYRNSKKIFNDLGMNLREFASNSDKVLESIEKVDRANSNILKVLGLQWNRQNDAFLISCSLPETSIVTKRTITSTIAAIYDPLGWCVPLLHNARVFLQKLWKEQYNWDTQLSGERANEWRLIRNNVHGFEKTLPRVLSPKGSEVLLVTFADASTTGMTACTYLVQQGPLSAHLLMARSKLPSLRTKATIPKLELNAVTLAMRLSNAIASQLEKVLNIETIYIFSDSEIVLSWIKRKPQRDIGIFVHNRLAEINRIADHLNNTGRHIKYGYVKTEENPADCGTRGLTSKKMESHLWWQGPWFLRRNLQDWPDQSKVFKAPEDDTGETIGSMVGGDLHQTLFANTSTITRLASGELEIIRPGQVRTFTQAKRVLAYSLRFINAIIVQINRKGSKEMMIAILKLGSVSRESQFLNGKEIEVAGHILIENHQKVRLNTNILKSLKNLNVRPDLEGIWRCHGRLGQAQMDTRAKYPILVLQKTALAEIIIRDYHNRGHPGVNHTMALIRRKFWIPQLRSQVARIVRKCIQCQKFNNLPYQYPNQGDLPKERVIRSCPFSNIGLDYFGPLTISLTNGDQRKCFGSIITCMVTRLVHLDIVTDLSTTAFLLMLRRFFARRGIPKLIISDNAPTFLLGESILRDSIRAAHNDPMIAKDLSNREIEWKHITPFAPWQGGFYERLIKSVKQCLYKTLGKAIVTFEELSTTIIEIESLINSRPLTYLGNDIDNLETLRPIDFLQKDIDIEFPLLNLLEEQTDSDYIPAADIPALVTKQQTIAALQTSCRLTERFWELWQSQYLISLREKHSHTVGTKRGSILSPKQGELVLVCDPVLPRQSWKVGIIDKLPQYENGTIREAVVRLPGRRIIRRPINLLIPLEIEGNITSNNPETEDTQINTRVKEGSANEDTARRPRYSLRPRKTINYNEDTNDSSMSSTLLFMSLIQVLLFFILLSVSEAVSTNDTNNSTAIRTITCIERGARLHLPERFPYEICAEDYCVDFKDPQEYETITFPPEVILHEHKVQWKLSLPHSVETIESTCPPAQFCPSIDCTFCSSNIFNPECWPISAILATATIVYFIITGLYVFLYVPLTVGRPVRFLASILWLAIKALGRTALKLVLGRKKRTATRRRRLAEILAIITIVVSSGHACQLVNVFNHQSTICSTERSSSCQIRLSEVLKINSFKREVCLRLSINATMILHEVRLRWKSLILQCEPETDFFTRDAIHKVANSKRCAHRGSCVREKCGSINASSLIPELKEGNRFPGYTACMESCGGIGCGCFFPSSGCLFFRIYMEPRNSEVFEIFHCNRWREAAEVEITHFEKANAKLSILSTRLIPNIPKVWNSFTFTMTYVAIPPLPLLGTKFLANSKRTAIWKSNIYPALRCATHYDAQSLNCSVFEDCTCLPAETKVICKCKELLLTRWINNLRNQLPATFPSLNFRRHERARVEAQVTGMVTAEIIMNFAGNLTSTILVDEASCRAETTELAGCYDCAKGAFTYATCYSSRNNINAEVICDGVGFTIPCSITGMTSTLRFSATKAQTIFSCSISCGKINNHFKVGGILKFTSSAQSIIQQWLKGEGSNSESVLPDLFHIAGVLSQWYKTLLATIVGLIIMLALTYLFFTTIGIRLVTWVILLPPRLVIHLVAYSIKKVWGSYNKRGSRHNKQQ